MKKISLKVASDLYDEIKYYKKYGENVCIYLHDDTVMVGYNNNYGISDFLENKESRILVVNKYKTTILIEDYYKKDAIRIIQSIVNNAIEEYNESKDEKSPFNEVCRNYLIRDLMRVLKGTHASYWKLYSLQDVELLQLYTILVPKNEQSVSIDNIVL